MKNFRFILLLSLFGCLQIIGSEGSSSSGSSTTGYGSGRDVVESPNIVHLEDTGTTQADALHALGATANNVAKQAIIDAAMIAGRVDLEDLEMASYRREIKVRGGARHVLLLPDGSGDRYYNGYDHTGRQIFYLPTAAAEGDGVGYDAVLVGKILTEESMRLAAAASATGTAVPAGRSVQKLPCGHVYHDGCIKRALASCGPRCPTCTLPAKKQEMIYVPRRSLPGIRDGRCYAGATIDCICGDTIIEAKPVAGGDSAGAGSGQSGKEPRKGGLKHGRADVDADADAVGGGDLAGAGSGRPYKAPRTGGPGSDDDRAEGLK